MFSEIEILERGGGRRERVRRGGRGGERRGGEGRGREGKWGGVTLKRRATIREMRTPKAIEPAKMRTK